MQGVFSDLYVVKGVEIGHEIVSVNLFEPTIENMADKIILTVAEAMSIEPPSPVFVLIGAVVSYNLKVIRGNNPQGLYYHILLLVLQKLNSIVVIDI